MQLPFYTLFFKLFGLKLNIIGKENIPPKGSKFLVLSNHQSFLDIPLVVSTMGHVAFLAKEELFKMPIFGWAIGNSGSLPVSRSNPRKNHDLPQRMKKNIDAGYNFCAFPEGTRSVDHSIISFKGGIFKYLREIQHPVIPITIRNSNSVLHKSSIKFFPGTIDIVIHPQIPFDELKDMEVSEMRDSIRETIISGMDN